MAADLRAAVRVATARLAQAGVPSPRVDATSLAGHVLGLDPQRVAHALVVGRTLAPGQQRHYDELVAQRAARVPLQHLTGRAGFRHLELHVGPGVFIPRPETEGAVDIVLDELRRIAAARPAPQVVDLCTGSGAIALAVKDEWPAASVTAVELSQQALDYATANRDRLDLDVRMILGDVTVDPWSTPWADLVGRADVVVSNPPYIPTGAVPRDPEVRDHDPQLALYGGSQDGLAVPVAVARAAASLLRPGGLLVMEHADVQGSTLPAALRDSGAYDHVEDRADLAGRPRHAVCRRATGQGPCGMTPPATTTLRP